MTSPLAPYDRFEMVYRQFLDGLKKANPRDVAVVALGFVEEACENAGAGDYVPEWLGPFASIVGRAVITESGIWQDISDEKRAKLISAITPVLAHAIRLGYTEGYFEAKADG